MLVTGSGRHLKSEPWRDKKARSLHEAAQAARDVAAAEHLPIAAALNGEALRWHAEAILKTVPVHGTKDGHAGAVALKDGAQLTADLNAIDAKAGGWRDLTVERKDFNTYLAWLRSVW
jgi:hypothetical protein